jgi:glycerol kinase
VVTETTALGAAFLAGLGTGVWGGTGELAATWSLDRRFEPEPGRRDDGRHDRWRAAVARAGGWTATGGDA